MHSRHISALSAVAAGIAGLIATLPAVALEPARLLRQPAISATHIAFQYAGDLWTVPRAGGTASRLTAHDGLEQLPKFSPDGQTIAFTGEYDGNVDVFTIPAAGGEPTRLTFHPGVDKMVTWYPDGKSLLIRSGRASFTPRVDQFFTVPVGGGFEARLPLQTSGYGSLNADGTQLAYTNPSYDNRTWKRYRGGNAPQVWTYDLAHNTAVRVSDGTSNDEWPMWYHNSVYFASDRDGKRSNICAYDIATKLTRRVTTFTDDDVKWPSIGSDAIVFEKGGALFVMSLPSEVVTPVTVLVPDDKPDARPEWRNVSGFIGNWDVSPNAKRAVLDARGDLFTVPAEKGDVRNLTHTPGARERDAQWSPDGKWIAYLSDESGDYQIHVIASGGSTPGRQVTHVAPTFLFPPLWSPDSKKIAFSDKTSTLSWCDVATGKTTHVEHSNNGEIHDYQWSGDSRWITYSSNQDNQFSAVKLYSLGTGVITRLGDGMSDDVNPTFDGDGKYLYFVSRRTVDPDFGAFEFDFQFHRTDKLYAVTLRDSLASPVAPLSDEESGVADAGTAANKSGDTTAGGATAAKGKKAAVNDVAWRIDLAGISDRQDVLPAPAGNYGALRGFSGKLLYAAYQPASPDATGGPKAALHIFTLDKREDKIILPAIDGYVASKDGGKILYKDGDVFGIVDAAEGKKAGDGKLDTSTLLAYVDPRQEWMQMFNEAWRLERDFYYDPAMGGLDWKALGEHYRALVPAVAHRSDLNYILGELIGELSTSHTYVGGGDWVKPTPTPMGLLGADYDLDVASGRYRFARVFTARDWNSSVAAPLAAPSVRVRAGDVLLAVNGIQLRAPRNIYAAFAGAVGKQTSITVGSSPADTKPRTYTVVPIASESSLRYTAWVADTRTAVDKATNGRVAYIHVPNTATGGIQEFTKQFFPQARKAAIIVDDRWNSGGFIPDFFIERLSKKTLSYWSSRDGGDGRTPAAAIDGPKCILINQYAGSGGDAFPYYFREAGLGPVIGERTWGGLVGISHGLPFVDGGSVTMPDFGFWDLAGQWAVENHGIDPDMPVVNAPDLVAAGHDPQLDRAIRYCLDELKTHPVTRPSRPAYKVR